MDNLFYKKYLKYKAKYLALGGDGDDVPAAEEEAAAEPAAAASPAHLQHWEPTT